MKIGYKFFIFKARLRAAAIEKYYQTKLRLWWKYVIKKNEFSTKLDLFFIRRKYKNVSLLDASLLVSRQRDIAHRLDNGEQIESIQLNTIVASKIQLF